MSKHDKERSKKYRGYTIIDKNDTWSFFGGYYASKPNTFGEDIYADSLLELKNKINKASGPRKRRGKFKKVSR